MKTLVIHPADPTTDFLKEVYKGLDCTVISKRISRSKLKRTINNNTNIIMLGHGTEHGLLTEAGDYIVDSKLIYLLRYKRCTFIWCNANMFAEKYKLKGFATGMIISQWDEALDYNIETSGMQINESNELFAKLLNKHIKETPKVLFGRFLYEYHHPHNEIVDFNADNIYLLK